MRCLCATRSTATLLTTTLLLTALASFAQAETTFPYQAAINGSDVYVRSGPGKNYYPTDKLQRGTLVEVYRHDPGGWVAIRPPHDSFSWIAGEHLRLSDDDIAEIVSEKAVAYVGSRFRDVHDVRQVQLDRGEAVQIVGEKRFTGEGGNVAQTWYKIMPPAGEFRWVYGKLLLKQQDADAVASNSDRNAESFEPTPIDSPSPTAVADYEPTPINLQPEAATGDDEGVAKASYEESAGEEPGRLPQAGGRDAPIRIAGSGNEASDNNETSPRQRTVDDLDVALSLIVAEEPDTWDFHDLAIRADKTIKEAESALLRGRARRVLREIARYETIQSEYFEAEEIREEAEQVDDELESEIENEVAQASAEEEVEEAEVRTPQDRFDGIGRLTPVKSKRIGAPPYALTDPEGVVLMFVTPTTDVKLQAYVGEIVGLTGNRGYLPELKAAHLTARRVELFRDIIAE